MSPKRRSEKSHELSDSERAAGGRARAEKLREQREEAEQEARAKLDDAVDQAVATLVAELGAEASADRIRAAAQILDRSWGRPRQAVELDVRRNPDEIVSSARAKLGELLERRRAGENGDAG